MSLLLDARKKVLQVLSAKGGVSSHTGIELSLEELPEKMSASHETQPVAVSSDTPSPDNRARSASKNLFSVKSPVAGVARIAGINRNLLFVLLGTILLLAVAAAYLWYIDSLVSSKQLLPAPIPIAAAPLPAPVEVVPQNDSSTTTTDTTDRVSQARSANNPPREKRKPAPQQSSMPVDVKPQQIQSPDTMIGNAYLAYRNGQLLEARQMYLEVLGKDVRNTDALLGLAAISQQLGEDRFAVQYYLRVLTLDPRNAVAHAGMSALNPDENSESRLKNLLHDQHESAALHFALGNIYAGQMRWSEAQSAYFRAYTLDTKNAELAFNLAVSLDHLGQNKMATQYYQRALQLEGSQPRGLDRAHITQRIQELSR